MKPSEKINTKGVLFVIMLVFEKYHVVSISLKNYVKINISILRTFSPNFEQVIPAENK